MDIPKYFEFCRPILDFLAKDKQARSMPQIFDAMAKHFHITKEQRREILPSGRQSLFENRVSWAKQYLFWCGLISRESRSVYKITEAGLAEAKNTELLNRAYMLEKYPALRSRCAQNQGELREQLYCDATAEEAINSAYEQINASLASELRENIANMSPYRFEHLVLDLLEAMGYGGIDGGSRVTQKSNDGGIDGVINQDKLGFDVIYIQAKRWQNNVGGVEIRNFVGTLTEKNANKGVFITTSKFCPKAIECAKSVPHKVILIDGDLLAKLMIEYDVGISTYKTLKLKRVDSDYFDS